MLKETRKDKQLSLKCYYGPGDASMEARCDDPVNLNVSTQWNITDKGCSSRYGPFKFAGITQLSQVRISCRQQLRPQSIYNLS